MDGFLALLGESEVFVGDVIAVSFSDLGHTSLEQAGSPKEEELARAPVVLVPAG